MKKTISKKINTWLTAVLSSVMISSRVRPLVPAYVLATHASSSNQQIDFVITFIQGK